MKVKTILFLLAVLVSIQTMQAQTLGQNAKPPLTNTKTAFKPYVHFSLGTFFYTFHPGVNGFGTYIAPEISMPINKKWTLSAGMAYTNFISNSTPEVVGFNNQVQNYGSVYVKGRYQVNEKMSITGMAYKTFSLSPQIPQGKVNPRDPRNSGAQISVDYKVTKHFSIDAAFSVDQRNDPFSPFGGYGIPVPGQDVGSYNAPLRTYHP